MELFKNAVAKVNLVMMWLCGFLVVFMGLSVAYDIIMRSFFKAPTQWAFELNSYLCAAVAFLVGGFTLMVNGHVRVDILYNRFSLRKKALVDACTSIFVFLMCAVMIVIGSQTVIESWQSGSRTGAGLNPPLFIPQLLVPLGGLLLALQVIISFIEDLRLGLKGKDGER
ncbi:MAG: TRAP transporter small permease subunit [Desulfotomaculales bacterium]